MDKDEKKDFLKNKKILFIIIAIIVLIAVFLVLTRNQKYKDLEESMLATTKNYVKTGRLEVKEEYYFTISQMGMKETYDCNKDSGVHVTRRNGSLNYEVYLICNSYKSPTMEATTSKYITILGANPLIVENNTAFVDPGYNSNGYVVQKTTNFKNSPGLYNVTYSVYANGTLKEKAIRYVIVSNVGSADAPVITLNGDENVILKVGSRYNEPGYVAIDPSDGTITTKVKISSNVNANVIGEYEVKYTVTNSKGLTSTKKRLVSVIDKDLNIYAQVSLSPEMPTKDKVVITLKMIGTNYAYVVLPDKSTSREAIVTYDAIENDLYTFTIYDNHGNHTEKKVFIDTIDRMPPSGNCTAVSQGGVVTYTVNGEDDSEIKGYSYYVGNAYTEFKSSNTFKYVMDYNLASVIIQDIAGNTTKISCKGEKRSTIETATMPATKTVYIGDSYTIPVTITPTSADRKEIYFDILSGNNYITLNDGVIKGVAAGTAVVRMRVMDSNITSQIVITVKKKEAPPIEWHSDPTDTSTISSWCTHQAARLTGYLNGRKLAEDSTVTMEVGETITITLYLTKECGRIVQLTRTSADGQNSSEKSHWKNWFSATSVPFVDRNDPSTFVSTDHFDWVITANKSTNGREVILSQTTFQSTSKFSEIKSFFRFNVIVK